MNNTFPLRHPEEIRFTQVGVGQPGWTSLGVQTMSLSGAESADSGSL